MEWGGWERGDGEQDGNVIWVYEGSGGGMERWGLR